MKNLLNIVIVCALLVVSGCTPPHYGANLLFDMSYTAEIVSEIRQLGGEHGFSETVPWPSYSNDFQVFLSMKSVVVYRREPITLAVWKYKDEITVAIGRRGGLGLALLPEEIAIIRGITTAAQKLRGFRSVKNVVGMTLAIDGGQMPNQALEPTTPAVTIPAAQEVAPAGVVAHL